MRFENLNLLYYGAGILLIMLIPAIGYFIKRRRLLERFSDKNFHTYLTSDAKPAFNILRTVLFFIGISLLLVAAARPQWGGQAKLVKSQGVEIMMALDISRSMLARDIKPDRFTRARIEMTELIDRLKGNRLGLTVFAGSSFVQCPMTSDTGALKLFLKAVSVGSISEGGTALASALETSKNGLTAKDDEKKSGVKTYGTKAIILLTDGEDHGEGLDEQVAALKKEGIYVFAVGIGSPEGEPIPLVDDEGKMTGYLKDKSGETVLSKLDEETLQKIVNETGGLYVKATDSHVGLGVVMEAIESMETQEFEKRLTRMYEEGYQYFLAAGLLSLFLMIIIPPRRIKPQKINT